MNSHKGGDQKTSKDLATPVTWLCHTAPCFFHLSNRSGHTSLYRPIQTIMSCHTQNNNETTIAPLIR